MCTTDYDNQTDYKTLKQSVVGYCENPDVLRTHSESDWNECHNAFSLARKQCKYDDDELCYLLNRYLVSWGMTRNSFVEADNHTIHRTAVRIILDPCYDSLQDISCSTYTHHPANYNKLDCIIDRLNTVYLPIRAEIKQNYSIRAPISSTLISKILLGTLCCVPAYDNRFPEGLYTFDNHCIKTFGIRSIRRLTHQFDSSKIKNIVYHNHTIAGTTYYYPDMKLIDMACWQAEEKNKRSKGPRP